MGEQVRLASQSGVAHAERGIAKFSSEPITRKSVRNPKGHTTELLSVLTRRLQLLAIRLRTTLVIWLIDSARPYPPFVRTQQVFVTSEVRIANGCRCAYFGAVGINFFSWKAFTMRQA